MKHLIFKIDDYFAAASRVAALASIRAAWVTPLLLALTVAACTRPSSEPNATKPGSPDSIKPHQVGGVDVGNMQSSIVPRSLVALNHPQTWSATTSNELKLDNGQGSSVVAKRIQAGIPTDPTYMDLVRYVRERRAEAKYEKFDTNGFFGFRAEIERSAERLRASVLLLSDLHEVIEIDIDAKASGITESEKILMSVRVLYRGEAIKDAPVKQAKMLSRSKYGDYTKSSYSFLGDSHGGSGVAVEFGNRHDPTELYVGTAGYDTGRIIELGSEKDVPFNEVRVDGEYLVSPSSRTPLAELYSVFSPKTPYEKRNEINLKHGSVYLLRTISWPDEDLIVKFRVDELVPGDSLTITYQKLVQVPQKELQASVDQLNEYTTKYERPRSEGEVTLFDRTTWGDYVTATFNFLYSTRDNPYITRNAWNLLYDKGSAWNGSESLPGFTVPMTWLGRGGIVDLGANRPLAEVKVEDFPEPMAFGPTEYVEAKVGHTYAILDLQDEAFVYGAVRVLEIEPKEQRWARLEWRRVEAKTPYHFQRWTELPVAPEIKSVVLDASKGTGFASFQPALDRVSAEIKDRTYTIALEYYVSNSSDSFSVDNREFRDDRTTGLLQLDSGTKLESVTPATVESNKGRFNEGGYAKIHVGGVYLAVLENYWEKTVMAFEVVRHQPNRLVEIRYKRLFVGQTNPGNWTLPRR